MRWVVSCKNFAVWLTNFGRPWVWLCVQVHCVSLPQTKRTFSHISHKINFKSEICSVGLNSGQMVWGRNVDGLAFAHYCAISPQCYAMCTKCGSLVQFSSVVVFFFLHLSARISIHVPYKRADYSEIAASKYSRELHWILAIFMVILCPERKKNRRKLHWMQSVALFAAICWSCWRNAILANAQQNRKFPNRKTKIIRPKVELFNKVDKIRRWIMTVWMPRLQIYTHATPRRRQQNNN